MTQPKLRFKREDGNEYPSLFQCCIKDVSSIKNGPFGSVLHSSDYVLEGTPIITTEHFKSGIIQSDVSTIPKVSEEDYKRLKGYVLETGDIVFSRVGSIDINALVTKRENGWLFSGRVIRVRLNSNYHSGYFHYLLSTQRVKNDIVTRAVGQTMPSINSEILNSTSLMITTSYEEQQKIADFLSTVDGVIAQSEAEVQSLEQQKKAAMQKIFSQEVRFKREDGTDYSEWEETKLESVCDIVGGGTPSTEHEEYWNGNIQWFTPSEIGKSKYVSKSIRTISQIGFERSSARKLPVGTVLLTSRATLGEMAITTAECTTNQGFQSLIPQKICGEYLYYLQPIIKGYCNKKGCGSTFNEISKNELGKCVIPFPCLEEQQKISDFLSAYDEAISYAKQELDKWKELKKGLLQQMFV